MPILDNVLPPIEETKPRSVLREKKTEFTKIQGNIIPACISTRCRAHLLRISKVPCLKNIFSRLALTERVDICRGLVGETRSKLSQLRITLRTIQEKSAVQLPPKIPGVKVEVKHRSSALHKGNKHKHEHRAGRPDEAGVVGRRLGLDRKSRPKSFGQYSGDLVRNGVVMVPNTMIIDIDAPDFPEEDKIAIQECVRSFNANPYTGIAQIKEEEIVEILEDDEVMPFNEEYDVSLAQFLVGEVHDRLFVLLQVRDCAHLLPRLSRLVHTATGIPGFNRAKLGMCA